jgi:hypothetical protein
MNCLVKVLFLASLVLAGGCARTPVVRDDPDFVTLRGNKFAFLIETYVYEELQDRTPFPGIGFPTIAPGVGSPRFPKNPSEWIGRKYGSIRILAVVPKGTAFTVAQHRVEKNLTIGTINHLDLRLDGPLGERWPLLDGFYLTPQMVGAIRFHPDVVKQL